MEYETIHDTKHYVYDSLEEFRTVHTETPVLDDWRDGEEGDWVWSDDGRIVQLLKVDRGARHPHDRKNYQRHGGYVRTIVGTFFLSERTHMDTDFDAHPSRYRFSKKPIKTRERIRTRNSCTKKERMFEVMVGAGVKPTDAFEAVFDRSKKRDVYELTILLLKQERIMQEIAKTVEDAAKRVGLTHEYVFEKLKGFIEDDEAKALGFQALKLGGQAINTFTPDNPNPENQRGMQVNVFQGFDREDAKKLDPHQEIPNAEKRVRRVSERPEADHYEPEESDSV